MDQGTLHLRKQRSEQTEVECVPVLVLYPILSARNPTQSQKYLKSVTYHASCSGLFIKSSHFVLNFN